MPLGVVTDEEFEGELNKVTAIVVDKKPLGRGKDNVEVPETLRKIIGEEGATGNRQEALAIAKYFGISPSSTSAYAVGSTSTSSYDKPDPSLKKHINDRKNKICQKAKSKLIAALNEITPEKLQEAKLRDISAVARDMAGIVKDMEPQKEKENEANNVPQFVIYAPQFKREDQYNTIVIDE